MYKPEIISASQRDKRLLMLLYGEAFVGKTTLALQFPKPIVLDLEGGAQYYAGKFDFAIPRENPRTIKEFFEFIKWLTVENHGYKTLVIDPITIWWEMIQDEWMQVFSESNRKSDGKASAGNKSGSFVTESGEVDKREYYAVQPSDWRFIKGDDDKLFRKLRLLDMNVIATAHEKALFSDQEMMKKIGVTFDGNKNMTFAFDTIVRIMFDSNRKRLCWCEKDRSEKLPEFKSFECTYSNFESMLGKERIEKESQPVVFSTKEQHSTIFELANKFGESGLSALKKRIAGYEVQDISELTSEQAGTIIADIESALSKIKTVDFTKKEKKTNAAS